jgi:hypothetical protein
MLYFFLFKINYVCFSIDICNSIVCSNGGACVTVVGGTGWRCVCQPGFTGDRCQQLIASKFFDEI